MGNANSSEIEQLKQLYSMNNIQLESLRKDLNEQKRINLQQEQHYKNLIGNLFFCIPQHHCLIYLGIHRNM